MPALLFHRRCTDRVDRVRNGRARLEIQKLQGPFVIAGSRPAGVDDPALNAWLRMLNIQRREYAAPGSDGFGVAG